VQILLPCVGQIEKSNYNKERSISQNLGVVIPLWNNGFLYRTNYEFFLEKFVEEKM